MEPARDITSEEALTCMNALDTLAPVIEMTRSYAAQLRNAMPELPEEMIGMMAVDFHSKALDKLM
jgi:hypothetical protein